MGLKSQVELTPPWPGQLGRLSGEDLIRLNSSEFKNSTSDSWSILKTEQGEVGGANVWKTQGSAVPSLTNIYILWR